MTDTAAGRTAVGAAAAAYAATQAVLLATMSQLGRAGPSPLQALVVIERKETPD